MLSSVTEPDPDGGGPLTAPVTTLVYDAEGNVTSTTDPLGHAVTWVYNAAGYETSATDPLNHTTSQGVDSAGQVASVTDPLSNQTTFQYTALGQQSQVTDPASGVLYSNYTSQGWLSTQQQSGGGTGTYNQPFGTQALWGQGEPTTTVTILTKSPVLVRIEQHQSRSELTALNQPHCGGIAPSSGWFKVAR